MENESRVVGEIDITAQNPEQAAKQALRIQRDPHSEALAFYVEGNGWTDSYLVDLMDNVLNGEVV
jgi:hypothetical protein